MATACHIRGGYRKARTRPVPAGANIHDIVMEFCPETGDWQAPVVCLLNDAPVPRKDWAGTVLAENDDLTFVELPRGGGGGGSNPLQIITTIAIIAVSAWAGPAAAAFWGFTGASGLIVGGLVSGAIMMAGSLLTGALFRTSSMPSGQLGASAAEAASPTYQVNGSNNQARMYQVIGEGFGRMQIVPDRVAQPWGYYIGNDMFLYQVLGLGRGSYEVESILIGDTVIWDAENGLTGGYEIELQFCEPGESVTLFSDNVETSVEVSNQEIFPPNHEEYDGWLGPYSAGPPGTKTSRIVNNLVLNRTGYYNDQGGLGALTLHPVIEAQRIDDAGNALGDWFALVDTDLTYATLTPQRLSFDVEVPEGRYQVRVSRTDEPPITSRALYQMNWESLFCFLPGTLNYNQSVLAMRMKANNELSQQASSSLKVIHTRKLPIYDVAAKTWSEPQPTRQLAAALSWILKTEWGGRLTDQQIDLDSLWGDLDGIMAAKGWTFDGYFDGAYKVWGLIMEICQPFRLCPRVAGGKVTFIFDQPGRPVRHIFTPRDIVRGSLGLTYITFNDDTPDDVIWSHLDEAAGFAQREVRCALPDSESRTPAMRSCVGVTNRDQAFQMGIYQAACNRKRRIEAKWQCEGLGRLLLMGDVCALNHPHFANLASGGVAWWDEDSLSFDLGQALTAPADGDEVYLALNRPNGQPWGPCKIASVSGQEVVLDQDDYQTLLAQDPENNNPFEWVDFGQGRMPTIWTLQSGREFSGRMIITSVISQDQYHYEVTAINDDPTVDQYDYLPTPPWNYRGPAGSDLTALTAPTGLEALGLGEPEAPVLRLSWLPVPGAAGYRVERKLSTALFGQPAEAAVNAIELAVDPGEVDLLVYAKDAAGNYGPGTRWTGHTDDLYPADDQYDFDGAYEGGQATLTWASLSGGWFVSWQLTVFGPDGSSAARRMNFRPEDTGFVYTREMAAADGVTGRVLNFSLRRKNANGFTKASNLTLTDLPPTLVSADFETAGDAVTITGAEVQGEYTGLIIVRGATPDFTITNVLEMRTAATLPYVWGGLSPETTYYFRVAAKDAYYDQVGGVNDLLFSGVQTVTTPAAA